MPTMVDGTELCLLAGLYLGAGQVREMSGVTVLTGPAIRAWKRQGCI